jgi:hypothetical protein
MVKVLEKIISRIFLLLVFGDNYFYSSDLRIRRAHLHPPLKQGVSATFYKPKKNGIQKVPQNHPTMQGVHQQ